MGYDTHQHHGRKIRIELVAGWTLDRLCEPGRDLDGRCRWRRTASTDECGGGFGRSEAVVGSGSAVVAGWKNARRRSARERLEQHLFDPVDWRRAETVDTGRMGRLKSRVVAGWQIARGGFESREVRGIARMDRVAHRRSISSGAIH